MVSVLIVDDEKLIRDTLLYYVDWTSLGIDSVSDASDGNQALEHIRKSEPDIIIADIKMPHMDGIQLAQIVREQYPRIRFVFLSGHADKAYLKEAIHLHVDAYIEKPLNLQELSLLMGTLASECSRANSPADPARRFFRGDAEGPPLNDRVYTLSNTDLQELEQALKGHDSDSAVFAVKSFCAKLRSCEGTSPEYIRNVFFQAALQLHAAAEYHHSPATEKQTAQFSQSLFQATRLDALEQELLRITEQLFAEGDEIDLNPVKLVNRYLQKNYADSMLTIDQLAQDLNFNASYLCTVYKQRTGQTINKALTDLRIRHACTYLESSDLQLKEIAALVGYSNGKYFAKVFLKEIGVSPKDYRRLRHV